MKTPDYSAADVQPLQRRYRLAQQLCIALLALLVAMFSWANLTETTGSWPRWLVQALPLALFIPGCWRGHFRTFSWLCFVVLFYFTAFVVSAMGPDVQISDIVGVIATVVLFCSAMMASRWRQHSRLALQQNPGTPPSS